MPKHMVKCLYCGQTFDASVVPFVKPNARRYAHATCAQSNEENKTKEERDKQELEEYIKQLFKTNTISAKIYQQIKTFKTKNNYSYSGMLKTLKYFFEIKGNPIEKANGGIGIIPFVYDEAFLYWRALWEARQRNEQIETEKFILPTREVHISPQIRQPMKRMKPLFTFLDEEGTE